MDAFMSWMMISPLVSVAGALAYVLHVCNRRERRPGPVLADYLLRYVVFLGAGAFAAALILFGILALVSGHGETMLAAFLDGPPAMAVAIVLGAAHWRHRLG
jgi:hypothetical protein